VTRVSHGSRQSGHPGIDRCGIDTNQKRPTLDYTRHTVVTSELRSLSQLRRRGDDGWLQGSMDSGWSMEESYEPRRLFNLEIHRGLGVQVPAFPENRHPAHEERTTAQVGRIYSPIVWLLAGRGEATTIAKGRQRANVSWRTLMDFATCEKCGRVLHESFWLQSGDIISCPACRMPATNPYAKTMLSPSTMKKSVASVKCIAPLTDRRLS
jgi:hypothetical protein